MEWLVLKGTRISDTTARGLRRYSNHRVLSLKETRVGADALDHSREELPDCRIKID
jgi:hypothetical protein